MYHSCKFNNLTKQNTLQKHVKYYKTIIQTLKLQW